MSITIIAAVENNAIGKIINYYGTYPMILKGSKN
jgi:hypothetical protein